MSDGYVMNAKELRNKSEAELAAELESLQKGAFVLRMQKASGAAFKPHEARNLRKQVARIKTLISERGLVKNG